jgi:hypothetical protein
MHYPVFSLTEAPVTLCPCKGGIYARSVIWVDVAPPFFDGDRRHVVPVHPCCTRITLKATSSNIQAERAKLGSIEGQLKAIIVLFARRFSLAPLCE